MYSVVSRLLEIVSAVELLLNNELAYQIRPLVRSAYDLFLNFYIDWLAPEHVGMLLQGLAVLSRTERTSAGHIELKESIKASYGGLADICNNMYEKGRLSPLGANFHRTIYAALSPAVHHDFGIAHEYGDALVSERVEAMSESEIMANVRWLDLVVAATVARLLDDVGASDGKVKEWPQLEASQLRQVGIPRPSGNNQGS